jgi:hypothetical protein
VLLRLLGKVGDPEASFIPPDVYRERQGEPEGRFAAAGIERAIRDNIPTVVAPHEE